MDEDVLLLDRRRGRGCESRPEPSGLGDIKETSKAHLGLDHGQPVRAHLRHHPQDVHKLVLPDVLHQTVQSDEGPRPADSGAADRARSLPRQRANS